ncbi:hypothetical protein B0H13DRAFT_2346489 [Mycena leptocephala]|nr:hypothetical protein B0H13DRAFT_2346489 [Mycena leptocephala]
MVSFQNWRKQPAAVVFAARDDDGSYTGALPPTPGLKPTPPSIAQLAFPSPDESSSPSCSSNTSTSWKEMPTLQRRNTFNFSLRRKKTSSKSTLSEDGHSMLPALPPPSPLTLNIPTFRPFHARRRDSWHVQPASQATVEQSHSSPAARGDMLSQKHAAAGGPPGVSLFPGTASPHRRARNRNQSLPLPTRRRAPAARAPSWRQAVLHSCAVTLQSLPRSAGGPCHGLTDEGISDELLVEKLEALRCRSRAASIAGSDTDTVDWDHVWAAYDDELDADDVPPPPPPKDGAPLTHAARTESMPALVSPSTTSWHSARRALLTCRELVRTERHYLASLHDLLDGATRVPPPPLMRAYAAALAKESAGLLRRMEEDPSAWGVAAAFVGAEDGVEAALVGWCGVVGGWFVDGERTPPRRLSKIRGVSEGAEEEEDLLEHTPVSSPPRALVARAVDAALRIAQRCDLRFHIALHPLAFIFAWHCCICLIFIGGRVRGVLLDDVAARLSPIYDFIHSNAQFHVPLRFQRPRYAPRPHPRAALPSPLLHHPTCP